MRSTKSSSSVINTDCLCICFTRSSFSILQERSEKRTDSIERAYRASILASSPSTPTTACGVLASITWGYTKRKEFTKMSRDPSSHNGYHSAGSNSSLSSYADMSFRNAFLHFLHRNAISVVLANLWSSFSAWHSGQSNHCLQHGALIDTWAFKMCLLWKSLISRPK